MLLDAHVAHLHFSDELIYGHASGPLEGINNLQPLGAANFCNQSLVHNMVKIEAGDFTRFAI
jgi:hypothetical protein